MAGLSILDPLSSIFGLDVMNHSVRQHAHIAAAELDCQDDETSGRFVTRGAP